MTDDFAVQQQRPSAAPYVITGGALGGVGAWAGDKWGMKWAQAPGKYSSYQDLLNEADDKFTSSMEGVADDVKADAKTAREKFQNAGKTWDEELAKFKEANKAGGTPELPADSDEMKKLADAEKALNDKRAELEKAEADKIRKGNVATPVVTTTKAGDPKKALEAMEKSLKVKLAAHKTANQDLNTKIQDLARRRYEVLANQAGDGTYTKVGNKGIKTVDAIAQLDKELSDYVSKLSGLTEGAKKRLIADSNGAIQNIITGFEYSNAKVPEFGFIGAKENAEKALNALNIPNSSKDIIEKYIANPGDAHNAARVDQLIKAEKQRLTKVEKLQKLYTEFAKTAKPEETTKVTQEITGRIGGAKKFRGINFTATITEASEPAKKLIKFIDTLDKADKAVLERLIGKGDLTPEIFEEKVKELKGNISSLESSKKTLATIQESIEKAAGKGGYIKGGKLYNAEGKVVDAKMELPKSMTTTVELPKGKGLVNFEKKVEAAKNGGAKPATQAAATLTEEQIKDKASKAVTNDMLKAEKDAVETAQKAVEEARGKLPKNPQKTAEELEAAFAKTKNVANKEDFVNKAAEEYKSKLETLFKGKVHYGKLAAILAGGVALGAGIGLMFKPKGDA